MSTILGTVLASKVTLGNTDVDTYSTHLSILGTGGYSELATIAQLHSIPIDSLSRLEDDGLSSGRRRLGQIVRVAQTDTIYQLFIPYNVWTGLTSSGKVSALANNSNWIEFTTGGGDSIKKKYQQTAHNFTVGNVLSFNGTNFIKGLASAGNTYEFLGVVSSVIDANNFVLTYGGYIDLGSVTGLSANTTYFVSPTVSGAITAIEPYNPGESSRPIILTQTTTTGLVIMSRSSIVENVGASGSTGNGMRIQRTTIKNSHGFVVGDAIIFSGNTYSKAKAIGSHPFPIGLVNKVFDPNTFIVVFDGYVDGFAGVTDEFGKHLSGGTLYYISPNIAGKLTKIKPSLNNQYIIPIYQSLTTDDGIVKNQNGIQVRDTLGQEIFVVPNVAARNAMFHASGTTGTSGQVESFKGLTVFVISATTGNTSITYIDATGFLSWSAITPTVNVILDWNTIINKPNVITGATNIGTGSGKIIKTTVTGATLQVKSIKAGSSIGIINNANDITIAVTGSTSGSTNIIGLPETGSTYINGIYNDFVPSTRIGLTIDRFNKLFLLVLPSQAPALSNINGIGTFNSGFLSWGVTKNDIAGYVNVGTNAGNPAVDINEFYTSSGTRLGITNTLVSGILNNSIVGNITGMPYLDHAFDNGDQGKLVMFRNGIKFSSLSLTGSTASTSNTYISVSSIHYVLTNNGSPVTPFKYRTGTYTIPVSAMTTGYNYFKIIHSASTLNETTNFIEFVYDSDSSNLTASATGLTNVSLSGTKNMSGVKYHTSGTVQYQATVNNAYKNVYSSLANAIDFPTRVNLGAITTMSVNGSGIVPRLSGTLQTLPILSTSATNPQNTSISILATLPINSNVVLGNLGATGKISSTFSVAHPITSQQISNVGLSTMTGFLFYNITQGNVLNSEDYTGEVNRLQDRDYSVLTYANVNSGTYAWDSTQSLIGGNALYNTGLLRFNGELQYPNAAYLTTQYGITTGNFAAVTNSPAGNVNYTSASGIRNDYRVFKSAIGAIQSTLTFTITHTGIASDFLTNGGTGGVPSGNNIKVEFLIMRSDTTIYGWANPFALTSNPFGIANTSTSQVGNIMTVSCTLSTTPRVGINDIVIVRIYCGSGYTNRIQHLTITNI